MASLEIRALSIEELLKDALPLYEKHHEEVTLHDRELNIDEEHYRKLHKSENYLGVGFFDQGILIGYISFFVSYHPHHKDLGVANMDLFYLLPEYRGGTGKDILKTVLKHIKERTKIDKVYIGVPHINDWSKMLLGMGFRGVETVYSLDL